ELGRAVFGVAVGRDGGGCVVEQRGVAGEAGAVVVQGRYVVEVADMVRQHRLAVLDEAERIFEVGAAGEDVGGGGEAFGQRDRGRGVAAAAAEGADRAVHHPRDRVVEPRRDR